MRTNLKRILAVLLAAAMLIPLAACAAGGDDPDVSTAAGNDIADEGETKDPNYVCDLPKNLNYGDAEVNIMYGTSPGQEDEMYSEKLGLGTVSDAVYERNLAVENQLGVKLSNLEGDNIVSTLQTTVRAGDSSLDIFIMVSYEAIPLAISGHYLDLSRLDYVDTSKHYWVQDYNDIATFTEENMQFLATSPAALTMLRLTYFTIFNKELMNQRQMPNLYDTVEKGEWTLDHQYSLIADEYVDQDGDGRVSAGDYYGYVTGGYETLDGHLMASGIRLAIRDENGDWIFNSEKLEAISDMVEKVSALNKAPGAYIESDGIGAYHIIDKFSREEALMATTMFLSVEGRIANLADIPYGIVPMPKLNREQAGYHTFVQDRVSSFGISAAIGDEGRQEMLGAVMESIAYHSNEIVRPAYYDTTLSLRFMQDPRSRDMLDIIFETLSFDLGYYVGLGNVRTDMRNLLDSSNPAVVSRFKAWEKSSQNTLKKYEASLDKLLK